MARILVHEVGPRDGLQMEPAVVPVAIRERWIRAAIQAGVDVVQVGAFVHPDKVPQMAATDELFGRLAGAGRAGTVLAALVLNERGLERGLACGVELFCMGVSASDTHSRRNTGMSTRDALPRIVAMAKSAVAAGRRVQVSVQSAFGCGYEGVVPEARVLEIARGYVAQGLLDLSLADTAGHATPAQVERLVAIVRDLHPGVRVTGHFHNTYGLGMANIFAATAAGATTIETSFGGLGGCPFTRVAAGNVATEDFVHALHQEGLRRDIDLDRLIAVARDVAAYLARDLPGCVHKTGPIAAVGAA